ncbi:MAG: carboxymuconolactone decarboxylase family protein [Alphaproteobacteria bacterium]|nr:carboxymuconolactone decarboxylase family protein [Alphaproteobacteria bacterium]
MSKKAKTKTAPEYNKDSDGSPEVFNYFYRDCIDCNNYINISADGITNAYGQPITTYKYNEIMLPRDVVELFAKNTKTFAQQCQIDGKPVKISNIHVKTGEIDRSGDARPYLEGDLVSTGLSGDVIVWCNFIFRVGRRKYSTAALYDLYHQKAAHTAWLKKEGKEATPEELREAMRWAGPSGWIFWDQYDRANSAAKWAAVNVVKEFIIKGVLWQHLLGENRPMKKAMDNIERTYIGRNAVLLDSKSKQHSA